MLTRDKPRAAVASPGKRPRRLSDSRVSLVISLALHAGVFLLLGIGGAAQVRDELKLTEISYIEERYGEEVAKQVTLAPEKTAPPAPESAAPPQREGSIFAKDEPADLAELPLPAPMPKPVELPNPFAAQTLKSRGRARSSPALPRIATEQVLLAAGYTEAPDRKRPSGEDLNLQGQVLVGREARLSESALFEVDAGDGPAIAGGALTLAVPEGGVATGHPELVGGSLAQGRKAYQGDLPAGNLVAKGSSRDRVTALASIQVAGPGDGGMGLLSGALTSPSKGAGLVSRGGRDAVSRGSLRPRDGDASRAGEALARAITPSNLESAKKTPAQPMDKAKGVSMTLSGPILDREILASQAPSYPADAKRKGWQGTVSVYFTVRADGSINKVITEKASPYQSLDEAAKRCLTQWRFSAKPGAAEQWGVLTIIFRLR